MALHLPVSVDLPFLPRPKVEVTWPRCTQGFLTIPLSPVCAVLSWMSRALLKTSPQRGLVSGNVPCPSSEHMNRGPIMDYEWGSPGVGGTRKPIFRSVCVSWQVRDTHLEVVLPAIYASHLAWVPGWITDVLACIQTCGFGGVASVR